MEAGRRSIVLFLALVVVFSSAPYLVILHAHRLGVGGGLVVGVLMWMPALAAFTVCRLQRIDPASLGWSWRPARYERIAFLLPVFYATPVYLACWLLIPHSMGYRQFAETAAASYALPGSPAGAALLSIVVFASFGFVRSLASALGEEIGWRGFLLPRLVGRFGFQRGCFFSGLIWAVWHYPALLFADYNSGTPRVYALACFTCMVVAMAFLLGWLRLQSRSLWPCAVLHASHNLFIQAILDSFTKPEGKALYVTTEFGFGLAVTAAVAAFYLIRKHPVKEPYSVLA